MNAFFCLCISLLLTIASASNGGGNITLDVEAKIAVVCEPDYIEVTLMTADYPGIIVNDSLLHLADASCVAGYKDDDMIKFTFGLEACGTEQTSDEKRILYNNKIYLTADEESDDDAITRKHMQIIPFQCGYDKTYTISKVSYSPRTTMVITDAEGYGNFTYEMFMYESEDMEDKVEEFPKAVGLGQPMYFGFQVTSADSQLNVFPDVCKATASSEFDSTPDHLIIENACSRDNTLKYTYTKGAFHNFSVSAFRFKENYDDVYIHCKLTVCRESDTGSRCDRGCEASRRRRRSIQEDFSANVRIGPLSYKSMVDKQDAAQEKSSGAAASNSMVMIVAVLVGILGTVALGLVIAVVVLGRRRRYAAVNKGAQLIVAEEM